ncbi:TPA: hypothetical protein ACXIC2_000121 [Stenotrophomonas maltophilia]
MAEWAAVVVGFGAAVGTILVATSANRTSKRAAEIAEEAKGIARQQQSAAESLRLETGKILGSLMAVEVSMLPAKLGVLVTYLDAVVKTGPVHPSSRAAVEWLLIEMRRTFLPTVEEVLDRLHNLPEAMGAELANLVGMGRGLIDASERVESRVTRVVVAEKPVMIGYIGEESDFDGLRSHVIEMLEAALKFARKFEVQFKTALADYSHEDEILKKHKE